MSYGAPLTTSSGAVQCIDLAAEVLYRVGYRPDPWHWTPWVYAAAGRFEGRWDDPDGIWRVLYAGSTELACYLEVLAPFRPDPTLADELADIVDDGSAAAYPTVPPGLLPRDWCRPRLICSAACSGRFVVPGHHESLATLRRRFLTMAVRCGCHDLDASAIRYGDRALTQRISTWLRGQSTATGLPADGIQYQSRHGDHLTLWAIYERDEATAAPPQITANRESAITPDDAALTDALRILGIRWSG